MHFPNIDPVLIAFGPFAIRWYSLAYVVGILGGAYYIAYLNNLSVKLKNFRPQDDLLVWGIVGIILGGRLGYIFFYNASYYLDHPLQILKLWEGGMSFHGGMIGMAVAAYFYAKKYRFPFLTLTDLCSAAAPIGLCFGRLANFINGELFGRPTDVSWGIIFPEGGDLPRHPSQLYEAFLEGIVLFAILFVLARFTRALHRPGLLSGVFLCGYSIFRMIVEQFREPDPQIGFLFGDTTTGQLLSAPMMILGVFLVVRGMRSAAKV